MVQYIITVKRNQTYRVRGSILQTVEDLGDGSVGPYVHPERRNRALLGKAYTAVVERRTHYLSYQIIYKYITVTCGPRK